MLSDPTSVSQIPNEADKCPNTFEDISQVHNYNEEESILESSHIDNTELDKTINADIDELERHLNSKEDDSGELDRLQVVNQEYYEKVQELEKSIQTYVDEIQHLKSNIQTQSAEFSQILLEKDQLLTSEFDAKIQTFDRLKVLQDQNLALNGQVEEQDIKLMELQTELDKVSEEKIMREESNVELTEIINEIKKENSDLVVKETDLALKLENSIKSLGSTELALNKAKEDLEKSTLKCIDLESQLKETDTTHQSQLKALQTEINDQKSKISSQNSEIEILNQQISKIDLSEKDELIESLKQSTKELTEKLNLLQSDLDSKISECSAFTTQVSDLEAKALEAESKNQTLIEELALKDMKIIEMENENQKIKLENTSELLTALKTSEEQYMIREVLSTIISDVVLKAAQNSNIQLREEIKS